MNLSAKKKMSLMRVEKKILRWKLTLKKDLELKSSGTYSSKERGRFCGSSFDTVCWHEYKDDLTWPTYMGTSSILSSKVLDRALDLGFYSSLLGNAHHSLFGCVIQKRWHESIGKLVYARQYKIFS